jgi:hypothetical protein
VSQGGQQFLAVDHERGVAVAIGSNYYQRRDRDTEWSKTVPDNLRSPAYVYWAGAERLPVAGISISVSRPDPTIMKALLPKLDEVRPALMAIERMKNPPIPSYYQSGKVDVQAGWLDMTTEELVAHLSKDDSTLKSVVTHGFASKRVLNDVPYLYVKGE